MSLLFAYGKNRFSHGMAHICVIKCHLHFSSSALNGKDYRKMFEDAERQREAGETPPPSTSPIHMHEHNNNRVSKPYPPSSSHLV